jgi:superfamily I DNA/RNA helicase
VGTWRLPLVQKAPGNSTEYILIRWWIEHVRDRRPAPVTFTMLNRLAELIQRAKPEIGRALRITYPYVFIDECQDTTYAQYDFLTSAFRHEGVKLTAVGDEKQRIMGWAGAKSNIFSQLEADYSARRIPLRCNYRSSPELVRIQQVLARRLDASAVDTESRALDTTPVSGDASQMWLFETEEKESEYIAAWIRRDMETRNRAPRDYVLLVRQTAERFDSQLAPRLGAEGLKIRNESKSVGRSTVQDVLAEPFTSLFQALMRLATRKRDAEAWSSAERTIVLLRGVDASGDGNQGALRRIENQLASFVANLRDQLDVTQLDPHGCASIVDSVVRFADRASIAEVFPEYRYGDNLKVALESIEAHFADSAKLTSSWQEALDLFDGVDCIPLMTVHKSKGLEFDTVVFVGLDDQMWWSYSAEDPEGLATFFVALSRAKKRANFTYCRQRGRRERIAELFELLRQAGVPEVEIADWM